MRYIVTSREMQKYDANTMEKIGIPGMVLMERAALAAFARIEERFGQRLREGEASVLVLAGVGNNGGDGLALARLLSQAGYRVRVCVAGEEKKASCEWKCQRAILSHYPVEVTPFKTGSNPVTDEYTVWVDALFGIGLKRPVEGIWAEVVKWYNGGSGFKLSLDIPSGLDADTGRAAGCAVRADLTVTFGFLKRGLLYDPDHVYTGEVVLADIGIPVQSFCGERPGMFCFEPEEERPERLLPERTQAGNKGTFGKILLAAGSLNMAGAAFLCAKAAYRTGAGMVKIITPAENREILQRMLPEALLGEPKDLAESLKWADVAVVGPGLGKSEEAFLCLKGMICESSLPLLIDGDGLNLLAEDNMLQKILASRKREVVLTPHMKELSRLTDKSVQELKQHPADCGMQLAERLHAVVAVKDARTFVCAEGEPVFLNCRGNSGMATAGSGDVLAGIIAGLLAQGMLAFQASCRGVTLHALAGENAAAETGEHAVMAGDLAEHIGRAKERRFCDL